MGGFCFFYPLQLLTHVSVEERKVWYLVRNIPAYIPRSYLPKVLSIHWGIYSVPAWVGAPFHPILLAYP